MKILGKWVLLDWEVFNWHVTIWDIVTSGLQVQLAKSLWISILCLLYLRRTNEKKSWTHFHLPCFHFARAEIVCAKKLITTLVSSTLTFFTRDNANSSLAGCCPVIAMSHICYVHVTMSVLATWWIHMCCPLTLLSCILSGAWLY